MFLQEIFQSFNYRKSYRVLLCFSLSISATDLASEFFQKDENDYQCGGTWGLPESISGALGQKDFELSFQGAHLDLQKKVLLGADLKGQGDNFYLRADKLEMSEEKEGQHLFLDQGVLIATPSIILKSKDAYYSLSDDRGQAKNVDFILLPWDISGQATEVTFSKKNFLLKEAEYTQCPPSKKSWKVTSDEIQWHENSKQLKILRPQLEVWGQKILSVPNIMVSETKGTNKITALPEVKVLNRRGLTLKFPKLRNYEDKSLLMTTDLSTKYGLAFQAQYLKEQERFELFSHLISFKKQYDHALSWKKSLEYPEQDVSIHIHGQWAYSDTMVNRYSDYLEHYKKQLLPSMISFKKKHSKGYTQLFLEHISLFEERLLVDRNFTQTPLLIRHFYQNQDLSSMSSFSIFKQTHQEDFARFFTSLNAYPVGKKTELKILHHLSFSENSKRGTLISFKTFLPFYHYVDRTQHFYLKAHVGNFIKSGKIQSVETRFLPMSFQSLKSSNWHNGNDWASRHCYLQWMWSKKIFFDLDFDALGLINFQKTSLSTQQAEYRTPFKNPNSNFSALGLKVSHLDRFRLESLLGPSLNELVSLELETHFTLPTLQGYGSFYYHNYFPDITTQENKKVRQLQFGLETMGAKTLEYFGWGSVDLHPFKINAVQIGLEQNECCFKQILGFNVRKEYSPKAQKRINEYSLTYKVEIGGLGFLRLGSQSNLSLRKIQRTKIIGAHKHFGYHF